MNRRVALLPFLLAGFACATSSTIQPADRSKSGFEGAVYPGELHVVAEDKTGAQRYRVFEQGATGFVSVQSVRDDVEQRASSFCEKDGAVAKTLTEQTSKPPHILGNFPRVEVVFVCVPKPNLAAPSSFQDETYIKLSNLKKLLDQSVITKEEFEAQKARILGESVKTATPPP
jgi:hypothetical protein